MMATAAVKSRVGLYAVVIIAVVAVTILAFVGYRLYYENLADTPQRAARLYLETLNKGDMVKLYDTTRGASSQTQAEFATMISALIKDNRLLAEATGLEPIGKQGNVHYYRVMAKLKANDGSYRLLPIILEAGREGAVWRVSLYVPPAAIPTQ